MSEKNELKWFEKPVGIVSSVLFAGAVGVYLYDKFHHHGEKIADMQANARAVTCPHHAGMVEQTPAAKLHV